MDTCRRELNFRERDLFDPYMLFDKYDLDKVTGSGFLWNDRRSFVLFHRLLKHYRNYLDLTLPRRRSSHHFQRIALWITSMYKRTRTTVVSFQSCVHSMKRFQHPSKSMSACDSSTFCSDVILVVQSRWESREWIASSSLLCVTRNDPCSHWTKWHLWSSNWEEKGWSTFRNIYICFDFLTLRCGGCCCCYCCPRAFCCTRLMFFAYCCCLPHPLLFLC